MLYTPIRLVVASEEEFQKLDLKGGLRDCGRMFLPDDLKSYFEDDERFLQYLMCDAFLKKNTEGLDCPMDRKIVERANEACLERLPMLVNVLGVDKETLRGNNISLMSEFRDLTVFPVVLDMWAHSKQVYKPDKDFALALLKTEKLALTREQLEHLPYSVFYVDLSALGTDVHGTFVKVLPNDKGVAIISYSLTDDLVYFSHYLQAEYGGDDAIHFDKAQVPDVEAFVLESVRELGGTAKARYAFNRKDLVALMVQLLAYISSQKPQIEESAETKHTYKPNKFGSKVKNKWSEVQMFEVGYAYGASFRKRLARAKEELGGASIDVLTEEETRKRKQHNSPKPHIRCAHWHRWRCGEGRQKLTQPRWMEPTFVGFSGDNEDAPVAVVHTISEHKRNRKSQKAQKV